MLSASPIWCFTLTTTLPLVVTYQKVGHRATELPDSITGLLTPVSGYLWNNARGRNQDPITSLPLFLVTNSWLRALALHKPLDSPWRGGAVLEAQAYSVPLSTGWEQKAPFLFPPNSLSMYFIRLQWTEKAKILAGNSFCYLMKKFNSPHYSSLLQNRDHSTRPGILLIFYNAKLEGNVQEKFGEKNTRVNKHGLKRPSGTWDQAEKREAGVCFFVTPPPFSVDNEQWPTIQLSFDTSGQWAMAYNSTQFWYYQPEDSMRLHRLRAQSYKTAPPQHIHTHFRCQSQIQVVTCSDPPVIGQRFPQLPPQALLIS